MMKSIQYRDGLDPTLALDFAGKRRILPYRMMCAELIVIFRIASQESAKVCFIDDDAVVEGKRCERHTS